MPDRLGTAATIATTVATLAVLLYIATGPGLAILMLVVSAIALAAWLRDEQRSESTAAAQPGRSFAAASTSAAWPSTFTLGQIRAIRPSAPIRKVARVTPRKVLPYMDFLPQTP